MVFFHIIVSTRKYNIFIFTYRRNRYNNFFFIKSVFVLNYNFYFVRPTRTYNYTYTNRTTDSQKNNNNSLVIAKHTYGTLVRESRLHAQQLYETKM